MVSELRDTALGMQAQVDEFVDQYAESTKRVIDRECSDVKKHEQDFVENAEFMAWHEEKVVSELRQGFIRPGCRLRALETAGRSRLKLET